MVHLIDDVSPPLTLHCLNKAGSNRTALQHQDIFLHQLDFPLLAMVTTG